MTHDHNAYNDFGAGDDDGESVDIKKRNDQ